MTRSWKCKLCDLTFDSEGGLIAHIRQTPCHSLTSKCHCDGCKPSLSKLPHNDPRRKYNPRLPPPAFRTCEPCGGIELFLCCIASHRHLTSNPHKSKAKAIGLECIDSGKAFFTASQHERHIADRHRTDILYHCIDCPKDFPSQCALSEHSKNYPQHGKQSVGILCRPCQELFKTSGEYDAHTSTKSHVDALRRVKSLASSVDRRTTTNKNDMIAHPVSGECVSITEYNANTQRSNTASSMPHLVQSESAAVSLADFDPLCVKFQGTSISDVSLPHEGTLNLYPYSPGGTATMSTTAVSLSSRSIVSSKINPVVESQSMDCRSSRPEFFGFTTQHSDSGSSGGVDLEPDPLANSIGSGVPNPESPHLVKTEPPEILDVFDELQAMVGGAPWISTFTYMNNIWSIVPQELWYTYTEILNTLCHPPEELSRCGFTLSPYTQEKIEMMQRCYQCRNGVTAMECYIHPGRIIKKFNHETRKVERYFSCCSAVMLKGHTRGCVALPSHTFESLVDLAWNWTFLSALPPLLGLPKRKAVVLDCEMCGAEFNRSELILLSVVDFFTAEVLINSLVRPLVPVIQWRTQYSGVSEKMMREAVASGNYIDGWHNARTLLFQYIDTDTILMGHSLNNDLDQLRLIHQKVIDSSLLIPKLKSSKHGVQGLSAELLQKQVQRGGRWGHDCLEDTFATRELIIWCLRNPAEFVARRMQNEKEKAEAEA
ncbi:hypothetical protein K440DRAFT_601563 [Wilcoxina mikolae CBS 423.85]|nr:hypothetical protein K440DRAFT_601563 [Wilcoxina mikolae CBS 423.85]